MKAQDVKYCFDQLCSAIDGNRTSSYLTGIVKGAKEHYNSTSNSQIVEGGVEGVRVVDDRTIQIELTSSYSYFLKILTQACCAIYPKEAYEMYGEEMRAHAVGTGPFVLKNKDVIIDYLHTENEFVDFDRERLLFKMNSNEGPCVCVDDFNGDGLDDFFVGSAKGSISSLFFQSEQTFVKYSKPFEIDIDSEDIDCLSGDFNGDGFVDLIVASGGSEYSNFSPELRDRLYLNNGKNIF